MSATNSWENIHRMCDSFISSPLRETAQLYSGDLLLDTVALAAVLLQLHRQQIKTAQRRRFKVFARVRLNLLSLWLPVSCKIKISFFVSFGCHFFATLQVRFTAFGERFDISLTPLRRAVGAGSRIRVLGADGGVLTDRKPRLCTYEGRLPHGGWVRAVVRSPTSVTMHFLYKV